MPVWFKPKRYGYGATPVTWQGWALTLGFVAAVFVLAWWLIGFDQAGQPSGWNFILFFKSVAILVVALWIISKRTTDGEWRWRWGQKS
jgi:hypothetical protein